MLAKSAQKGLYVGRWEIETKIWRAVVEGLTRLGYASCTSILD